MYDCFGFKILGQKLNVGHILLKLCLVGGNQVQS